MFSFRIAYRFADGEVEGFVGAAFADRRAAERAATRKVAAKCEALGEEYREERLIRSPRNLPPGDYDRVLRDWKAEPASAL